MPRRRGNMEEYCFVVSLVFFEGIKHPTVSRGFIYGTLAEDDLAQIKSRINRWQSAKVKQTNDEAEQSIDVLMYIFGKKSKYVQRSDLAGVEDIGESLAFCDSQPVVAVVHPSLTRLEEEMEEFLKDFKP